jgi:TrmH family RNA methyltransferase
MNEIQEITSPQNPKIKQIVKLRTHRTRKSTGLFVIDEAREVTRALACGQPIVAIYYCEDFGGSLAPFADNVGSAQIYTCPRNVFEKIAYRENPDGILAVARQREVTLGNVVLGPVPLIVIATAIEKPANLGAILRTADGAGADAVVVCDSVTDIYNPNVMRASTGTFFSMNTVVADTPSVLEWLKVKGIRVVCTTPDTEKIYHEVDMTLPTAIVVGSEKDGLPDEWLEAEGEKVRIPMEGVADSLNVSVSAALVLYEAVRQRRCL